MADNFRGVNISNYKIVLVKSWDQCQNFKCGLGIEEIATTYTDQNGDYSITFNYKAKAGETYSFYEQYYGDPYYPEYATPIKIYKGTTNTININAWKPTELRLNVEVLSNKNAPLMIRNEVEE